jgi:hypothetical protein
MLVLKDGTRRRLTLSKDFRVIYFDNRSGDAQKLDLARTRSVEFIAAPK